MAWNDWLFLLFLLYILSPIPDFFAIRKMEKEHPEWFE